MPAIDDRTARHNAVILCCAQALGGANPAIVVSLGGLVGQAIAPDPAYATLPVSLLQLGIASGTIPAALVMRRLGRRGGYFVGTTIGVVAGSVAAAGAAYGSFGLFCLGTFLAGFYSAYVQSYRFAATDAASPGFRARAIAWVMAGGVVAGIVGPQTVIWTRDLVPHSPFAGGFLGQAVLALLSFGVVALLRPTPVAAASPTAGAAAGRPLGVIFAQPRFLLAVVAGLVSYGLMSFVMTAAPLAMVVECGHSLGSATLGIQWHILAMYGPSFFTAGLIGRFGRERVVIAGLVLIAAASAVALGGTSVPHFWTALVLLGIGWNFGFIGATALVAECCRPEERTRTQAMNDFLVFGCVAVASFSSGTLVTAGGWTLLNWIVLPVVALTIALMLWGLARRVFAPAEGRLV
ncbi:MFS transporter [Enterovirga aerilata]|uniref:MFS transporter n=1 Tax=Enterovirga aerilata TaxID=2730920 RepID=A0A849IAM0_9HYPH|nr:MFS transporter [Enterovirga sp. DB1703]NNM73305.1 MFS transporter [Enterovirga sp. DB1703]